MLMSCEFLLVWVAHTVNKDYRRMQGWDKISKSTEYRKDFLAGNMTEDACAGELDSKHVGNTETDRLAGNPR